jgi:hypothetical protein
MAVAVADDRGSGTVDDLRSHPDAHRRVRRHRDRPGRRIRIVIVVVVG